MLVLSRKPFEKILIPSIKTTVQVVAVKPGVVRLGIEAPREVKILRAEVPDREAEWGAAEIQLDQIALQSELRKLNHLLRNRLNGASIGFAVLNRQLRAGLTQEAETTLAKIDEDFQMLRQRLEGEVEKIQARPPAQARKSKALLVEDNPNECELLATLLRMANVDVDTAGDGADALDYLQNRGRPDVMLLDMGLPRCDGPTIVRAVRRNPAYAGLKIFAVTGHAPDEFDLKIGPGSIDRWFQKPLDPAALLTDINSELAHSTRPM